MNALYNAFMIVMGTAGVISAIVLTCIIRRENRRLMSDLEYREYLSDLAQFDRGADTSPTASAPYDVDAILAPTMKRIEHELIRIKVGRIVDQIDASRKAAIEIGKAADPHIRN